VTASVDSTVHAQAWKRDPADVGSHVASRRLTQAVNQHKQKQTGKTLQHVRAATLTLGIVHLPTDSVRKVYRVKRNKAKGKVSKQLEPQQGLAYLDLWQKLVRGTLGQIRLECGIYRKKAAADMYILPSSAHSKKLKQGILKGEFLRFITLCSTEKEYDKACERYSKALQTRGYSANDVDKVRRNVKWESKRDILTKREEKEEEEREGESTRDSSGD